MSYYVPEGYIYDNKEDLLANHPDEEPIPVSLQQPQHNTTWDARAIEAVKVVLEQINDISGKSFRFREQNEGCRLIKAAYDRLREGSPPDNTHDEAVEKLRKVVDFGAMYWLNNIKMRKYFTPASLFRKGKWEDRASAIEQQHTINAQLEAW